MIYYRQHGLNQVGAKISNENLWKVRFQRKQKDYFNALIALRIIRDSGFFSEKYDNEICEFVNYYKRYYFYNFSLRSLFFRVKYFQYFLRNYPLSIRLLGACASVFGMPVQMRLFSVFKRIARIFND